MSCVALSSVSISFVIGIEPKLISVFPVNTFRVLKVSENATVESG